MYIGLLSILLLCLQFGFTQEVSVFNNSNEYMEHLDLVSNTFLKKKKENLELLGQRLYRMSLDLNIKKFKKES